MCQICKDGVELPTMMSTSRSLRDILLGCKHCLRARPGPHRNRVTSPCHKFCKICRLKILTSTWNQEDLKTQLSTPELKSNLSDHPSTALLEELTKPSVSSTSSTEQREDQDMTEGEQAVENQEVLKFELFPKLPVQYATFSLCSMSLPFSPHTLYANLLQAPNKDLAPVPQRPITLAPHRSL